MNKHDKVVWVTDNKFFFGIVLSADGYRAELELMSVDVSNGLECGTIGYATAPTWELEYGWGNLIEKLKNIPLTTES